MQAYAGRGDGARRDDIEHYEAARKSQQRLHRCTTPRPGAPRRKLYKA